MIVNMNIFPTSKIREQCKGAGSATGGGRLCVRVYGRREISEVAGRGQRSRLADEREASRQQRPSLPFYTSVKLILSLLLLDLYLCGGTMGTNGGKCSTWQDVVLGLL